MLMVRMLNVKGSTIGILSEEDILSATMTSTLKEARELNIDFIVKIENKKLLEKTRFIVVFDGSKNRFFRKDSFELGSPMSLHGIEVGYDDFSSSPVTKRVDRQTLGTYLYNIIPSDYTLNFIGVSPNLGLKGSNSNLDYNWTIIGSALDNLTFVTDNSKLDFDFSVVINSDGSFSKELNIYDNLGSEESKYRYVYGKNAKDVVKEEQTTDVFTAAVGLGYNLFDNLEDKLPDFDENTYTLNTVMPLTFRDVEWKTTKGNPVDKPFNQEYVEIPEFTQNNSQFLGKPRIKVFEYPEVTDASILIKKTYDDLLDIIRPKIQFRMSAENFYNTGVYRSDKTRTFLSLGDSVNIIHHDLDIKYKTRVFRLTLDLITSLFSDVEFGDLLYENRAKQLKEVNKKSEKTDKKADANTRKIASLEQTIRDLNQRINDLEQWTGIPKEEEEVIEHSPATYFTYSEYNGGYAVSGLSTLGQQAVDSGLTTHITTPEVYSDLPVKAVVLGFRSNIVIPNFVFRVTKNIEHIDTSQGTLVAKHLRLDEGIITIGAFAGLNTKSKSLRIPDSVTSFASDYTYYKANIERISVPYFYNEIPNSGTRSYVEYVQLRDPEQEKNLGDFTYLEVEKDGSTIAVINGYTENGVSKKDIVVPEKIGSYAVDLNINCFRNYNANETITFEGDLYKAPAYAFHRNTGLKKVVFKSLEAIDSYAFSYCTSLINLDFGTVILNSISAYAFQYVGLTSFIMPNSVQSIGDYAFYNAKIKNLKLSNQLTYISAHAFDSALIEGILDIPKSVVNIYEYAFINTKLTGISLTPDSMLANIERQVFTGTQIYAVTLPSFTFTNRNAFNSGTVITRF